MLRHLQHYLESAVVEEFTPDNEGGLWSTFFPIAKKNIVDTLHHFSFSVHPVHPYKIQAVSIDSLHPAFRSCDRAGGSHLGSPLNGVLLGELRTRRSVN